MKGVTIGDGAVIAGNSVVTTNVPAHSMASGNPAKVVRQLTDAEIEANRHNAEHYVDLLRTQLNTPNL